MNLTPITEIFDTIVEAIKDIFGTLVSSVSGSDILDSLSSAEGSKD